MLESNLIEGLNVTKFLLGLALCFFKILWLILDGTTAHRSVLNKPSSPKLDKLTVLRYSPRCAARVKPSAHPMQSYTPFKRYNSTLLPYSAPSKGFRTRCWGGYWIWRYLIKPREWGYLFANPMAHGWEGLVARPERYPGKKESDWWREEAGD